MQYENKTANAKRKGKRILEPLGKPYRVGYLTPNHFIPL
jgi:hypothetical protein